MKLAEQEHLPYLANVIWVARADGSLSPRETAAIDEIRLAIGAKKGVLKSAAKAAESGSFDLFMLGSLVAQVCNVSDMLYACHVDGDLAKSEEEAIRGFCRRVGLTDGQVDQMFSEAIARAAQGEITVVCPSCSSTVKGNARFCPNCGTAISHSEEGPAKLAFEIPKTGFAIEFCESSSGSFAAALDFARSAPTFLVATRINKSWYLAAWPEQAFASALKLGRLLSGIRNRRCYHNGAEIPWEQLFGFAWCAQRREAAYRPIEYCFGKDENRVNPWGCKQARMDWTEWATGFSYGQFKSAGILKQKRVWVFDKAWIGHELAANLHRYEYCPYIRRSLAEAVLRALPDEVEVTGEAPWKYSQSFEERPGSINVVEVENSGGFEFKREYFADGVRPKGLGILEEVLRNAFAEAGVTDIAASQITR
ncbi:MAG: zinc ribbon domain-containing protein [Betaproteobacteria bacterium]|nr:zinc ribbon domain-containing protein [Betaproteobacteria bacterium]